MWSCFKDPSLQPALNGPAEQSNCAAWLRGGATELQRQHEEHAAALLRGSCEGREEDAPMAAYFVGWFGGGGGQVMDGSRASTADYEVESD
jgi:hypothetical protein